jgi:hypothetical protein
MPARARPEAQPLLIVSEVTSFGIRRDLRLARGDLPWPACST